MSEIRPIHRCVACDHPVFQCESCEFEQTLEMYAFEWNRGKPPPEGDARKLVTLVQRGMTWVGIRAYNFQQDCWQNGNEPELADVIAWTEMPLPFHIVTVPEERGARFRREQKRAVGEAVAKLDRDRRKGDES